MDIQFIGLKILDEEELSILNRIVKDEKGKLEIEVPDSKLIIQVKKYNKEGKRSKYSLQAKLNNPNTRFAAQSDEWELSKAVHKVFDKLGTEIHHRFEDN